MGEKIDILAAAPRLELPRGENQLPAECGDGVGCTPGPKDRPEAVGTDALLWTVQGHAEKV